MFKFLKQKYNGLLKCSFSTNDNKLLAQCIKERTLLKLCGEDASNYLQGLITNDMKHLEDGAPSMFTMFLNSKGRILYDSIIYNSVDLNTYFIECDVTASGALQDHLLRYKVKKKITIDCLKDKLDVWTVINNQNLENPTGAFDYKKLCDLIKKNLPNLVATIDPRLKSLGLRIITPKNFNLSNEIEKGINVETKKKIFYKVFRYKLGIGEGLQELPPEKCFPMEANGDFLHGISFHKGCYIGQELTARTYHTGVIRKRLMPLVFNEEIKINEHGIPIFAASSLDKSIGKLQGVEKTNGVGFLRIEEALKADELMVSETKCKTYQPFWWPKEASKERMNIK